MTTFNKKIPTRTTSTLLTGALLVVGLERLIGHGFGFLPVSAHTLLSPALNIGLLLPGEVADAAEIAYREGRVPIASAEGFVRQVIGWREYVWGTYWRSMPGYDERNALGHSTPLPDCEIAEMAPRSCSPQSQRSDPKRSPVKHSEWRRASTGRPVSSLPMMMARCSLPPSCGRKAMISASSAPSSGTRAELTRRRLAAALRRQ